MTHTLQTTGDYTDGFTTDLSKIQQQILTFVEDMQPVCRRVIKLNAGSYAHSTINDNVTELLEMGKLEKNDEGAFIIP